jgi:hypothetical protein
LLDPDADEQVCIECSAARTTCLDADPIPRRYLVGRRRPKLSAAGGPPHLLLAGSATDDGGRYDYRELIGQLAALQVLRRADHATALHGTCGNGFRFAGHAPSSSRRPGQAAPAASAANTT